MQAIGTQAAKQEKQQSYKQAKARQSDSLQKGVRQMTFRNRQQGSSIAEYALPMALVVVASGVIAASVNIEGLLPQFFAEASGSTYTGDTTTIAAASGTTGPSSATGDGSGQLPGLNANAGQTGSSLGLDGQTAPNLEVSGGNGTQVALGLMNTSGGDVSADEDEADYEAGSTYVAMVKDLALTTATADDVTEGMDDAQSATVLDDYATSVAAKSNAIQQYAFENVIEVLRNGGVAGLKQVNDEADESEEDFNNNRDDRADEQADGEEEAVENDGVTAEEQADVDSAQANGTFLYTLDLYQNTQYQAIEDDVFEQWRTSTLNNLYGTPITIWAFDYEGSVSVLEQSWGGFLDGIN